MSRKKSNKAQYDTIELAEDSDSNKRLTLSISEKIKILKKYESQYKRLSQRAAATKLGITQPTLFRILKNRKELFEDVNGECTKLTRKRKRNSKCHLVDLALYEWYKHADIHNLPITRKVLMKKANDLAIKLDEIFKANSGWVSRWMHRHNIELKRSTFSHNIQLKHNIKSEVMEEETDEIVEEVILEITSSGDESVVMDDGRAAPKPNHERIKLEHYGMDDDDDDDDDFLPLSSSKKKDRKSKHALRKSNSAPAPPAKKPTGPTQATINARIDVDNEFELFGKSIAVQLKKMPLDRALICQEKLQQVVTQERLTQMQKKGNSAVDDNDDDPLSQLQHT